MDHWQTPEWLKRGLHWDHRFDPCPLGSSKNMLIMDWKPDSVVNPPFSQIKEFVEYSLTQPKPQTWVVPATPDRRWYQTLTVNNNAEPAFFARRIFKGSNFASALVFVKEKGE